MARPVKVLLLVENNGYPRDFRVRREAHALRDAGCQVDVICPREAGQAWTECDDGVVVHRYPAPPGGRGVAGYVLEFGWATAAIALLTCWVALIRGVEVVHAANPPDTLFIVGALCRLFGKRYVFDHHDLAPELYLARFRCARPDLVHACLHWLERCSVAVADVVITTNESYRQRAIERGGKRPDRVVVVRNGPPLSYRPLTPPPPVLAAARRRGWLIGYVGTIGPQDGVDHLMRALAHLIHGLGRQDVLAVVIGDGDALPGVRALARELHIERQVTFTGWLAEQVARRHLSGVDVCVQPDSWSALNNLSSMNKLVEYMALGKATVAFDLHETRCTAQDAALYARPDDDSEFADKIAWLLDHPKERRHMGRIGRQRVQDTLAWEYSAAELLRAYGQGLGLAGRLATPAPRPAAAESLPRVTVIVPCHNYGRYLDDCLGSITSQHGVAVDIIVIDDASTDDSAEVAAAWVRRDSRIQLIRHAVNQGHIATFNQGLALARGDYLLLLSADDLLTPGALARASAVMLAHPEVGLVYGHPVNFERLDDATVAPPKSGCTVWPGARWIHAQCRRGLNCIYSPEALVRTRIQRQVGEYSADLPHTADLEMWLRIAAVADVAHMDGADQALRRCHPGSLSATRYGEVMTDLVERHRAFERFFAGPDGQVADASRCRQAMRQRLAQDALGEACELLRRQGDVAAAAGTGEVEAWVDLARRITGHLDDLPAWRELCRLRQPRRSAWDRLALQGHALRRDLSGRLRWRRWRALGV